MDQAILLWLVQAVVGALIAVLGLYVRSQIERMNEIKRDLSEEIDNFRKELTHDMEILTAKVDGNDQRFTRWRHDTYAPLINGLQLSVYRTEEKVSQIEKRMNGKH